MDQQKIGIFLKELRKEKQITQEQLANYLNVSNRSVSRWETGNNLPDLDILILLSKYYDVQLIEILEGEKMKEEKQLEKTKGLPCYRYTKEFFTIEPMDKMVGISRMMKHLGASLKDMVVFGDGENDCTMFSDQWISIAMGNACDLLKEKATFVTKTLEEDGVYYACKHFGWIE